MIRGRLRNRPRKLIMCSLWISFFMVILETQAFRITVNLTDGPGSYAGRVEVKYNGNWGRVCDYGININVGHVICRQLGYPQAIATPCNNAFGPGNTCYGMTSVRCDGNESSLAECDYNWERAPCTKGLKGALGVVCEKLNMTVTHPLPLRLAHASVPYAGCVQVEYAGIWGQIGMFGWDQEDGRVACRQLGYPDVLTVLYKCFYPPRYFTLTWMDSVKCTGNELSLSNCTYELITYRSAHWTNAGVVCKNNSETVFQIRLRKWSVSYAGRVEVFLAGKWGAINSHNWRLADAHVTCRRLGFSGADLAVRGATYVFNAKFSVSAMGIQWIDNVECLGNESYLHECPHEVFFVHVGVFEAGVVCKTENAVK
ncbi:soluble scavenger receptor cysteine-rich domain-containing protein SSC5D-like, partial [Stylophora pistillata]|uniref:soluble scavenger receptor cysteine-rich domain-containing protein SSC5D-like n=1 Tax=Stylophora pistillata TaxID=50429 RepID=UPI000C0468B2